MSNILPLPPRGVSGFVGLDNPHDTCYLNSFLQILFLTPEFTQGLYSLDPTLLGIVECEELQGEHAAAGAVGTADSSSTNKKKTKILRPLLFQLQWLFTQLQEVNMFSISTVEFTTHAFEWESNETHVQHDVTEFASKLISRLVNSLEGTVKETLCADLFQGIEEITTTCKICKRKSTQSVPFYQVTVEVSGFDDLGAALTTIVSSESVEGYQCERCSPQETTASRTTLLHLPQILFICCNRLKWDKSTPKKIRFKFPIYLDVSVNAADGHFSEMHPSIFSEERAGDTCRRHVFIEDIYNAATECAQTLIDKYGHECDFDSLKDDEKAGIANLVFAPTVQQKQLYELFAVIIHCGKSDFEGHYVAHIKDLLGKGNYRPSDDLLATAQPRTATLQKHHRQQTQMEDDELFAREISDNGGSTTRGQNKRKRTDTETGNSTSTTRSSASCAHQKLAQHICSYFHGNFYEFDDDTISPVPFHALNKAYGGDNAAYMLVYRRNQVVATPEPPQPPQPPQYWQKRVNETNDNLKQQRDDFNKKHPVRIFCPNAVTINNPLIFLPPTANAECVYAFGKPAHMVIDEFVDTFKESLAEFGLCAPTRISSNSESSKCKVSQHPKAKGSRQTRTMRSDLPLVLSELSQHDTGFYPISEINQDAVLKGGATYLLWNGTTLNSHSIRFGANHVPVKLSIRLLESSTGAKQPSQGNLSARLPLRPQTVSVFHNFWVSRSETLDTCCRLACEQLGLELEKAVIHVVDTSGLLFDKASSSTVGRTRSTRNSCLQEEQQQKQLAAVLIWPVNESNPKTASVEVGAMLEGKSRSCSFCGNELLIEFAVGAQFLAQAEVAFRNSVVNIRVNHAYNVNTCFRDANVESSSENSSMASTRTSTTRSENGVQQAMSDETNPEALIANSSNKHGEFELECERNQCTGAHLKQLIYQQLLDRSSFCASFQIFTSQMRIRIGEHVVDDEQSRLEFDYKDNTTVFLELGKVPVAGSTHIGVKACFADAILGSTNSIDKPDVIEVEMEVDGTVRDLRDKLGCKFLGFREGWTAEDAKKTMQTRIFRETDVDESAYRLRRTDYCSRAGDIVNEMNDSGQLVTLKASKLLTGNTVLFEKGRISVSCVSKLRISLWVPLSLSECEETPDSSEWDTDIINALQSLERVTTQKNACVLQLGDIHASTAASLEEVSECIYQLLREWVTACASDIADNSTSAPAFSNPLNDRMRSFLLGIDLNTITTAQLIVREFKAELLPGRIYWSCPIIANKTASTLENLNLVGSQNLFIECRQAQIYQPPTGTYSVWVQFATNPIIGEHTKMLPHWPPLQATINSDIDQLQEGICAAFTEHNNGLSQVASTLLQQRIPFNPGKMSVFKYLCDTHTWIQLVPSKAKSKSKSRRTNNPNELCDGDLLCACMVDEGVSEFVRIARWEDNLFQWLVAQEKKPKQKGRRGIEHPLHLGSDINFSSEEDGVDVDEIQQLSSGVTVSTEPPTTEHVTGGKQAEMRLTSLESVWSAEDEKKADACARDAASMELEPQNLQQQQQENDHQETAPPNGVPLHTGSVLCSGSSSGMGMSINPRVEVEQHTRKRAAPAAVRVALQLEDDRSRATELLDLPEHESLLLCSPSPEQRPLPRQGQEYSIGSMSCVDILHSEPVTLPTSTQSAASLPAALTGEATVDVEHQNQLQHLQQRYIHAFPENQMVELNDCCSGAPGKRNANRKRLPSPSNPSSVTAPLDGTSTAFHSLWSNHIMSSEVIRCDVRHSQSVCKQSSSSITTENLAASVHMSCDLRGYVYAVVEAGHQPLQQQQDCLFQTNSEKNELSVAPSFVPAGKDETSLFNVDCMHFISGQRKRMSETGSTPTAEDEGERNMKQMRSQAGTETVNGMIAATSNTLDTSSGIVDLCGDSLMESSGGSLIVEGCANSVAKPVSITKIKRSRLTILEMHLLNLLHNIRGYPEKLTNFGLTPDVVDNIVRFKDQIAQSINGSIFDDEEAAEAISTKRTPFPTTETITGTKSRTRTRPATNDATENIKIKRPLTNTEAFLMSCLHKADGTYKQSFFADMLGLEQQTISKALLKPNLEEKFEMEKEQRTVNLEREMKDKQEMIT